MCSHQNTVTTHYEHFYRDEGGPGYEIVEHTYCVDCGATIEAPLDEPEDGEVACFFKVENNHVLPL